MLRTKNDEYGNVIGVLHNKRFVIRINVNEDLDNEFEYLGGEGFTFIPYKETTPAKKRLNRFLFSRPPYKMITTAPTDPVIIPINLKG